MSIQRIANRYACAVVFAAAAAWATIATAAAPRWEAGNAACSLSIEAEPAIGTWQADSAPGDAHAFTSSGGYALTIKPTERNGKTAWLSQLRRTDGASFRVTQHAYECSVPLAHIATLFSTSVPYGPSVFRQAPQIDIAIDVRPNAGVPFLMACDYEGRSSLAFGPMDQAGTYRMTGRVLGDRYVMRAERREFGRDWFEGLQLGDGVYVSTQPTFWFDAAREYADTVDAWDDYKPHPIPASAYEPFYSTWYGLGDDINTQIIRDNAVLARDMGMGNFLIFIGWATCEDWFNENSRWGDYTPCKERFEDFAALVKHLQDELGLKVQVWAAPTWIGKKSESFETMQNLRSKWPGGGYDRNLDPRNPRVREHIRERFAHLAKAYGIDGVYMDFLDTIYNRNDCEHAQDPRHFGTAYGDFLAACYAGLASANADATVEYRIPFANLLSKHHANVFTTTYVQGDYQRNVELAIALRPFARGVMLRPDALAFEREQLESRDEVGRIMSATLLCGPPGLSMDLTRLEDGRREHLSRWLGFYRDHAKYLSQGEFRPYGREYQAPEIMVTCGERSYARVSRWETGEIPFPKGTKHAFIFTCLPVDVSFIARVDLTRVTGLVPGKYRARWYDSSLESHDGDFQLTVKDNPPRPSDAPVLSPREFWDFHPDEDRPSLDIRRGGFLELQLIE